MKKIFKQELLQALLVLLGIFGGIYFSILNSVAHNLNHDHSKITLCSKHSFKEISNDSIIPQITHLKITKDAMSGWNLNLKTRDFFFNPENVNAKHIPGQGHAHLLINGKKIARIYSHWYHIQTNDDAMQEVEIILTTNSHETMTYKGQPISKKLYNIQ